MSKDINKEIDEVAEDMAKSTQTPAEALRETILQLGPEGIRAKLPTLEKSEKELLVQTLESMTKASKAVAMDDQYQAKYVQGNVNDTKIQEDKADDDQDEKLVKPEAAKMTQQGTPTDGWEGQVIKADKSKDELDSEKEAKKMAEDEVKEEEGESKADEQKEKLKEKLKKIKKSVEDSLTASGTEYTPDMVKAEMKKLLKEEEQSEDELDELQKEKSRGDKSRPEELKLEEDNKDAQKKVDQMAVKKAEWASENDLLKACGNGQNHHFSVNSYYDSVLEASETLTPVEEVKKSEGEEDLNDMIAKGQDSSADDVACEKLLKSNQEKVNGKVVKSFETNEIAEALGLTEEEAKAILGE